MSFTSAKAKTWQIEHRERKLQYLIIDGYNIINAWEDLRALAREDLEDSREKLIDEVIEYAEFSGYKAIIVFDAYNVKNSREKVEKRDHVTVVYTKEHQTADSYIEKFITTLSEYDDVKVVTNDYAEQQIIMGKGAARVSARELRLDIDNSKVKIREKNVVLVKKLIEIDWMKG
nr:NYN domain-containing protein [Clostridioides mangenotii]